MTEPPQNPRDRPTSSWIVALGGTPGGVARYLTRGQALNRLMEYAVDRAQAEAMLDQPGVTSAPWPGQPGRRLYLGADVEEMRRLLVEWIAVGRPGPEDER